MSGQDSGGPGISRRVALVTGATGFVGYHLCRHLATEGWAVTALVRPDSDTADLRALEPVVAIVAWHGGVEELAAILRSARTECVFHLASLFLSEHGHGQIDALIEANIRFGTCLAEAMTTAGVSALVNTGTFWQHYQGEPYRPVNLYAATKQAFEAILRYYTDARGLRAITLKLSDTYGPHDKRGKLISALAKMACEGGSLQMSAGEQELDIAHIDDVVRAFALAAERCLALPAGTQESFAVSSGQQISLKGLVALFEQAAGTSLAIAWGARPYRPREVMHTWRGGEALPGWAPAIPLEEGLARLLREG